MRNFCHWLTGHRFETVAYSVMGAPIQRCAVCGQYVVLYGYGSCKHFITEEEANEILGEVL